jgi:hypothetical protein
MGGPLGSRKQETGSRKQEAGSRKQEAGSRKQETGNRKQETGSKKPNETEAGEGKRLIENVSFIPCFLLPASCLLPRCQ